MSVADNFKNQSSTENCQKSENGKYANSLSSKPNCNRNKHY